MRPPTHPDDWIDCARWARRHDRLPDGLGTAELPGLLEALSARPDERDLATLFRRLRGWEACEPRPPKGPAWWRRAGRAARRDGEAYDRLRGLPLAACHLGARLALVPLPAGGLAYLDEDPVTAGRVAGALRGVPGTPRPPVSWREQRGRPGHPLVFVDHAWARAFAAAVGGRLPTDAEFRAVARAARPRVPPPRRPPPPTWRGGVRDARFGLRDDLGLRGLRGDCAAWCADRRGTQAAVAGRSWRDEARPGPAAGPGPRTGEGDARWWPAGNRAPHIGLRVLYPLVPRASS